MQKPHDKTTGPRIEYSENGPYHVQNVARVIDTDGKDLVEKPERMLCRCGKSRYKPFCDGTHIEIAFNDQSSKQQALEKTERYIGEGITIFFNRSVCIQSTHCYTQLPSVFGTRENRVVNPDAENPELISDIIARCPSGALICSTDTQPATPEPLEPLIKIEKDGPYAVQGGIDLIGADMRYRPTTSRYLLCRCGESSKKPFCDGTHQKSGFRDDGLVMIAETDSLCQELTRVSLSNKELVIVKRQDTISVFSGVCLHAQALLADGFIEDDYLTCGRHRWRYNLETGQLDGDPAMRLKKLTTICNNGQIFITQQELDELTPLEDD